MSRRICRLWGVTLPILFALGLSLALILVSNAQESAAGPVALPVFRYVAAGGNNSGNDCTSSAAPCATIQHAVDMSEPSNEIRVAEGVYAGTQTISRTLYGTVYSYTQVVYVNKSLTLRGGYSTSDWGTSDPEAHPTVIDAQRAGRSVTIIDTLNNPVTLEGFTVTGGDYTGLGNPYGVYNYVCDFSGSDCGGGIFINRSAANLRRLVVSDNIAGTGNSEGGGIYLEDAQTVTIEETTIFSNSADYGGGLFVMEQYSPLTIRNSTFLENIANDTGGGINLGFNINDLVTIEDTAILSNTTNQGFRGEGEGGGLYGNLTNNGLILYMNRVRLQNNQAYGPGKAMFLQPAGPVTPTARLENLLLTGNGRTTGAPSTDEDAVISVGPGFTNFNTYFAHLTAAANDVGGFLYAEPDYRETDRIQVVLTNTLLTGFDNAFIAREPGGGQLTIQHANTLLYSVANLHLTLEGTPVFSETGLVSGDPKLDGSYHLQSGSAAIDAGIEAGVSSDLDGQFRPQAAAPDIGADEFLELVAPAALVISGPGTVVANTDNTFLAEVGPINTTRPLTYVWSATGQEVITHVSGGISDTVSFNWPATGAKTVSLTVYNSVGGRGESYPVTVIAAPALVIGKNGPAEAISGSTITYELLVGNEGVAGATGLVITDTVPANVTGVTALDGGTVIGGQTVQWALPSLAGGSSTTLHFQVTADQTIVNDDYAVRADDGYSAKGDLPVTTVFGQPQLAIGKSGPLAAAPGQHIDYVLTITNTGNIAATGLVVSDTLPAGAAYISGGTLVGGVVRWEPENIPAGEAAQVILTVAADQTITNIDYRVKAAGGFEAVGSKAVSTIVGAGIRYVAGGGSDSLNNCTSSASPCATIQHAVNVANPGEEIRVASGTYAGSQTVTAASGTSYKQVVFIDKSLTLRGGYTTANWIDPDPAVNPTVINAQRAGRGITILNTQNNPVNVEGFTITGGDYTGLGNPAGVANKACDNTGFDCGGGLFAAGSAVSLINLAVEDNIAGGANSNGGGIFLWDAWAVLIEGSTIISNSAGSGGGLYVHGQDFPLTIAGSTFEGNTAGRAGGILLATNINQLVTVVDSAIISNTASLEEGGGMIANLTNEGLILQMDRVKLQNNQAYGQGKALYLDAAGNNTPEAILSNLLFSGNRRTAGAPIPTDEAIVAVAPNFTSLVASLMHVTAAGNPVKNFLLAEPAGDPGDFVTVVLTNTLVSGSDYAYAAREGADTQASIAHTNSLLYNVTGYHADLGGAPGFSYTGVVTGDPKLDNSYHLTIGSAAIDAGAAAGVTTDIDGDARPQGSAPDIGADEYILAPPGEFGKSSPAGGATNQPTSLTLSWGASENAAGYQYCFDTSDNNSCDGSWSGAGSLTSAAISGLNSGTTYFWQVRAFNSLDTVEANGGDWWSFTTGTAPAAFGKFSPANGAADRPASLNLIWNSSSGATGYEYCYDTSNNSVCDGGWNSAGSSTLVAISGLNYGTTYYWQVRAVNNTGSTEANSGSWWSFSTGSLPGAFGKNSPANGVIDQPTALTLSWGASAQSIIYEYCYDTVNNSSCDTSWGSVGANTSVYLAGLSTNTTYYWQVRAVNNLGSTEADNFTWWSFKTGSPPAPFGKTSPANGAADQTTSPTLYWGTSANATGYEYCYDTSNNSSCDSSWISAGTNNSVALSGLNQSTPYYWQVRANNGLGSVEANSGSWWSFTTGATPGAFGKSGPADGVTDQATSLNLSWAASGGATGYEYCYDTSDNDSCDTTWSGTGGSTGAAISGLSQSTTYYWQVRANNNIGSTAADGGSWWSFTTTGPPGAFGKSSPADKATLTSVAANLAWTGSTNADSYEYCYDTTNNNSCDGSWTGVGSNTSANVSGLTKETTYYWQVRAENVQGKTAADGGSWWSFTTGSDKFEIFLPGILARSCGSFPGPTEMEDNDNAAQANGPLCSGLTYSGSIYHDNEDGPGENTEDWFYFAYSGSGAITVDVSTFPARAGVLLYHESDTTHSVAMVADQTNGIYHLEYGGGAGAGRYYIRLYVAASDRPVGAPDYNLKLTFK